MHKHSRHLQCVLLIAMCTVLMHCLAKKNLCTVSFVHKDIGPSYHTLIVDGIEGIFCTKEIVLGLLACKNFIRS